MKVSVLMVLTVLTGSQAFAQFKNVIVDQGGGGNYACEPSVAINPRNTKNIVAVSVMNNIYVSTDAGLTWEKKKIESPYGVYGDPVIVSDPRGNFYYFHLSDPTGEGWKNEKSLEQIVCHVSGDGGKTWDSGSPIGANPPKDQDKPWAFVDSKGDIHIAWTQFDKYNSTDPSCESVILYSSSSNGKKWSKPLPISNKRGGCTDDDNTVAGGVPAVSDDKKMYVAWAHDEKIYMDRSFDGGNMWLSNDIEIARQPGGWKFDVSGHDRCNGLPAVVIDKTKSERKGMLYVVWSDQRNGKENTDVWFIRSNNFGDNWTTPYRINDDTGLGHQYLPAITIDNVTGYIYILFYDRREDEENLKTDVYLAWSKDAGATFKNIKLSDQSFMPDQAVFFGDYIGIHAHKGTVAAVWTRVDDGKTAVVSSVFTDAMLEQAQAK